MHRLSGTSMKTSLALFGRKLLASGVETRDMASNS